MLAVAQPDFPRLRQGELRRAKASAFMRTIAHRLVAAVSAGAPPVVSSFQFQGAGFCFVDFRGHDGVGGIIVVS